MASDYTIRDAGRADIDTIVAFTLQEVREAEGLEPDLGAVSRGVRGGFEDAPQAAYWVAEAAGGRVVSSTSVVREWSDFHGAHYWWVQSLFIIPEHRGKGLVELLLRHLAREADAAGALDLRALRPHHQRTRSPGLPPLRFRDGAIRHHDEAPNAGRGRDELSGWRPRMRIELVRGNARVRSRTSPSGSHSSGV
jgi:L-amino acid N-acyltransferase YncA